MLARLAQGLLVVVIAASVAFLLLKSVKGDQFSAWLDNPGASVEAIAQARAREGNTEPLFTQYATWFSHVARGDLLASSMYPGLSVREVIGNALPNTLLLMTLALGASIAGGIALGAWQGMHSGTRAEKISSRAAMVVISMPDFWVAMLLVVLFALRLGWLPAQGMSNNLAGQSYWPWLWDRIQHLVLPWLSLTLVNGAVFSRYQRAAMRDVVSQQFLRTARAKGVDEAGIRRKHALRVAVLPLLTIAGMFFPALLVGTILIEKVFAWPGMGSLLTGAIANRDYALVAGIVIVGSAMTALGSFLADIAREVLDPRLRA